MVLVSLPVAMPQYLLQVWKRFPFAKNEYHKWKILGSKRSVTYRMEPESCSSFCYKLLSNMTCGLHQYRVSSTTKGQARKGMSQGRVHRIAVVHWCNIDTYSKSHEPFRMTLNDNLELTCRICELYKVLYESRDEPARRPKINKLRGVQPVEYIYICLHTHIYICIYAICLYIYIYGYVIY